MPHDYAYDVFLSYRRGERLQPGGGFKLAEEGRWLHEVFLPDFRARLDHVYPQARIALDTEIPSGSQWEPELHRRVLRAKCLVAVWSPMYFRSEYCRSEFHTVLVRQQAQQASGRSQPIVIPVVFSDGEWFDDDAKGLQYRRDFSPFSGYVKPIQAEQLRGDFVAALDGLCREVAAAIHAAPPLDTAWRWCHKEPLPPAHFPLPSLRA
jgi:hypothetical protein